VGWKAGMGTQAAMAAAGIEAPLVGFLTERTLQDPEVALAVDGWANAKSEPEVALRLRRDVSAGASRADVLEAVGAIGPAIEVVDLGATEDIAAVLAGNIFHRAFWLGPMRAVRHGLIEPLLDIEIDGATVATEVDPTAALGDLVDVVAAVADQLPLADAAARAGDVVITGSAVPAIALEGVGRVAVRLHGGGTVTAQFC
jgi:2-keto-4-pentenoate hydratase